MSSLPDLAQVKTNLAFTCSREADHLPSLDPQADQLFQYARYLQKCAAWDKQGATSGMGMAHHYLRETPWCARCEANRQTPDMPR